MTEKERIVHLEAQVKTLKKHLAALVIRLKGDEDRGVEVEQRLKIVEDR